MDEKAKHIGFALKSLINIQMVSKSSLGVNTYKTRNEISFREVLDSKIESR
jgi:hypothetical protein